MIPVRFSHEDAIRASDEWGANCGPGAIAAITGMTLDEIRPQLGDFESRGYTNPTLMWEVLARLGAKVRRSRPTHDWPRWGLCRVQWEGPWTEPGVPMRVRYRHTHWVGCCQGQNSIGIFDINCMHAGGWVQLEAWRDKIVPWIIANSEGLKRAYGTWHLTHAVEVEPAKAEAAA